MIFVGANVRVGNHIVILQQYADCRKKKKKERKYLSRSINCICKIVIKTIDSLEEILLFVLFTS